MSKQPHRSQVVACRRRRAAAPPLHPAGADQSACGGEGDTEDPEHGPNSSTALGFG